MKLDQETIELLMGKHLDGEISSAEARLLQTHLDRDAEARQLLDQLQDLHHSSQEAVTEAVLGGGRSAQDIIHAALQQSQGRRPLRFLRRWVFSQFAAGLAAGLLIATTGALLLSPTNRQEPGVRVAGDIPDTEPGFGSGLGPGLAEWTPPTPNVRRNIDWIVLTDKLGRHYLLEGLREDRRVTPAIYRGDF